MALADLEARLAPHPRMKEAARRERVEAAYEVAKARCEEIGSGRAAACKKEARVERDAKASGAAPWKWLAKAQAKLRAPR